MLQVCFQLLVKSKDQVKLVNNYLNAVAGCVVEGGYKRLNSDLGVGKFVCIEVGTSLSQLRSVQRRSDYGVN